MHLGLSWFIFSKIFSILRNTLRWHSKKIVHLLSCVFRSKLNKAANIFCRLPEWIRNVQMIPGFSTRLGWEHGWKSCMANSKDWRSENVNAIELNRKVVKKVATPPPPFPHQPPPSFSGLSSLSRKKFGTPQVTQFLGDATPPPFNKGGGVPTVNGNTWTNRLTLIYLENVVKTIFICCFIVTAENLIWLVVFLFFCLWWPAEE